MLLLFALILIGAGVLLLIFTEQISINTIKGVNDRLLIVTQQFLGTTYIALGTLLYLFRNSKGRYLSITLTTLFIMGCIFVYLLFQFNPGFPPIYFVFQVFMQLLLLFALIDEVRKK